MFDVFKKSIRENHNLSWAICGDGSYRPELEDKIAASNLHNRIFLLGKIPRAKLFNLYRVADAFWLMSRSEPFGLVFIEAAYFNLPSLGPNRAGAVEAIAENESGSFLEDGEDLTTNLVTKLIELSEKKSPENFALKFDSSKFAERLLA